MERVKINLPTSFNFSTVITIRITDINYGGHVGNDSFLSLVHEARQQYLHHLGYSEINFEGTSLIMADAAIEFKKELVYANQVKISIAATGFDKYGFDLLYLMEVMEEGKPIVAARVKTGMLCFNYTTKKLNPLPAQAKQKLTHTTQAI